MRHDRLLTTFIVAATTTLPATATEVLWDNGLPDGCGGHSNGTSGVFGFRRGLLDDFVVPEGETWRVTGFEHRHVFSTPMGGAEGTGLDISIWTDLNGEPEAPAFPLKVTSYTEEPTGGVFFSREEIVSFTEFEPLELGPGHWWFEGAIIGPENNFWLTRCDVRESEHWVNYEDLGGLRSGTTMFGAPSDLNFRILGTLVCDGDIDHSGAVDFGDLLVVLSEWGPCAHKTNCPANLNGDGVVDFEDLVVLLGLWGCARKA